MKYENKNAAEQPEVRAAAGGVGGTDSVAVVSKNPTLQVTPVQVFPGNFFFISVQDGSELGQWQIVAKSRRVPRPLQAPLTGHQKKRVPKTNSLQGLGAQGM
jgi:hypothetical protein